jgi:hypothetical protein
MRSSDEGRLTLARDDEHERKVRLLLRGNAAVSAGRFERQLVAEMDDDEQSARRRRR